LRRDAGRKNGFRVGGLELVGADRQLLEEDERCGKLGAEGRSSPVGDDRVPDLFTERVRRNCAVGARSERALVDE
jgi:hypothetical protein